MVRGAPLVAAAALAAAFAPLFQTTHPQPNASPLTHVDGLGSISFPNSGNAAAQAPFVRGVLLLHSFEYGPAAESFRQAQAADPAFALAYWGEAMTYNHPLWQQQDRDAALKALLKLGPTPAARAERAPTDRERQYLGAVETIYLGSPSKHDRDAAYMRAMERLTTAYPADLEARAFYALSILGSRDGVRDFATYMRAAATVQPVFDANPDHPGAAHYLIHSFDDPIHAPLGLPAARRYASIAPAAAHAQHMTSHIFVALGMWDDVVTANERADAQQNADAAARGARPSVCGHYTSWLQYGYLMQGQAAKAERVMDRCFARMSDQPTSGEIAAFADMRARQILDTQDWPLASRWTRDASGTATPATYEYLFTNAFAALQRGDVGPARTFVAMPEPKLPGVPPYFQELRAMLAIHDGHVDDGLASLRAAADGEDAMPFEFGPPAIAKPTAELLGEQLLKLGKKDDARAAFERAAQRTPGRIAVVSGLKATAKQP
jgi:tetratricopeptide (TPR) repeat protein